MKIYRLITGLFAISACWCLGDGTIPNTDASESNEVRPSLSTPIPIRGMEITVENVVVTTPDRTVLSEALKNKIQEEMSLRELLSEFGKGWLSPFSGIGNIQWFFDDGTVLSVGPPPITLNQKMKVRTIKEDKEVNTEQGGPGYPPQGVGSPDP